jgi:hypothetical protein
MIKIQSDDVRRISVVNRSIFSNRHNLYEYHPQIYNDGAM